jgi:hypothetical protein
MLLSLLPEPLYHQRSSTLTEVGGNVPENNVAWATKSGASGSKGIREGPATWLGVVLIVLAMLFLVICSRWTMA